MPTMSEQHYQCHCLTAHLSHGLQIRRDIFSFDLKDILRELYAQWPDRRFLGIPFAEFSHNYYLPVSNKLAEAELKKRGLTDSAIAEALASRKCGGCGFHAYRMLRDNSEKVHLFLVQEAA